MGPWAQAVFDTLGAVVSREVVEEVVERGLIEVLPLTHIRGRSLHDAFVIVDEAQDFADSWWQPVIGALRDRENGRLMIVGDVGQSVFQRAGRPPVDLVPLVLDHNLRNTRQIASAFLPLVGHLTAQPRRPRSRAPRSR